MAVAAGEITITNIVVRRLLRLGLDIPSSGHACQIFPCPFDQQAQIILCHAVAGQEDIEDWVIQQIVELGLFASSSHHDLLSWVSLWGETTPAPAAARGQKWGDFVIKD